MTDLTAQFDFDARMDGMFQRLNNNLHLVYLLICCSELCMWKSIMCGDINELRTWFKLNLLFDHVCFAKGLPGKAIAFLCFSNNSPLISSKARVRTPQPPHSKLSPASLCWWYILLWPLWMEFATDSFSYVLFLITRVKFCTSLQSSESNNNTTLVIIVQLINTLMGTMMMPQRRPEDFQHTGCYSNAISEKTGTSLCSRFQNSTYPNTTPIFCLAYTTSLLFGVLASWSLALTQANLGDSWIRLIFAYHCHWSLDIRWKISNTLYESWNLI